MVSLRAERARLLGYETFAAFKSDTMAKSPEHVASLLRQSGRPRWLVPAKSATTFRPSPEHEGTTS